MTTHRDCGAELWDEKRTALQLGCSESFLRSIVASGNLSSLFRPADVQAFIDSCRIEPKS